MGWPFCFYAIIAGVLTIFIVYTVNKIREAKDLNNRQYLKLFSISILCVYFFNNLNSIFEFFYFPLWIFFSQSEYLARIITFFNDLLKFFNKRFIARMDNDSDTDTDTDYSFDPIITLDHTDHRGTRRFIKYKVVPKDSPLYPKDKGLPLRGTEVKLIKISSARNYELLGLEDRVSKEVFYKLKDIYKAHDKLLDDVDDCKKLAERLKEANSSKELVALLSELEIKMSPTRSEAGPSLAGYLKEDSNTSDLKDNFKSTKEVSRDSIQKIVESGLASKKPIEDSNVESVEGSSTKSIGVFGQKPGEDSIQNMNLAIIDTGNDKLKNLRKELDLSKIRINPENTRDTYDVEKEFEERYEHAVTLFHQTCDTRVSIINSIIRSGILSSSTKHNCLTIGDEIEKNLRNDHYVRLGALAEKLGPNTTNSSAKEMVSINNSYINQKLGKVNTMWDLIIKDIKTNHPTKFSSWNKNVFIPHAEEFSKTQKEVKSLKAEINKLLASNPFENKIKGKGKGIA